MNKRRIEALRAALVEIREAGDDPRRAVSHLQDQLTDELLGKRGSPRRASKTTTSPRKRKKLTGKAKAAFLARMAKGRKKAKRR